MQVVFSQFASGIASVDGLQQQTEMISYARKKIYSVKGNAEQAGTWSACMRSMDKIKSRHIQRGYIQRAGEWQRLSSGAKMFTNSKLVLKLNKHFSISFARFCFAKIAILHHHSICRTCVFICVRREFTKDTGKCSI